MPSVPYCVGRVQKMQQREHFVYDSILWLYHSLRCCHISPDSVNGRRTDRKNTKNVYPVVKVVSVAMKVVIESVGSA